MLEETYNISVTQAHIDEARIRQDENQQRSRNCPVALAITEALGLPCRVAASSSTGWAFVETPEIVCYVTSYDAIIFINRFDMGSDVKPFTFTITKE